jgi:hypothetical protein
MTEDRASIPRLYFEARTLAEKAQAEDEANQLDATMNSLIAMDISEGEAWSAISKVLKRLKVAKDWGMIGNEY